MAKIYVAAGHGGSDPGASKGNRLEKNYTLTTAMQLADHLRAAGHIVVEYRRTDTDYGLTPDQRVNNVAKQANASGADYFIDVHYNATPGAYGVECYHSIGDSKGQRIAQNVSDQIAALGLKNRGAKTKAGSNGKDYFGVIRMTSMTANLVECAFIDSDSDMALIDQIGTDKIAKAICNGICAEIGGSTATPTPPTATPQPSEVVAMVTANGVNVRQQPTTSSAVLGKLNNGNLVKVVDDLNAGPWIGIAYNGGTAYIARQYTNCDNGTRVETATPAAPKYSPGTYTLTANVKVRTGPGTGNRQKSKSELTTDGQRHANTSGVLQSGTVVTVKEVQQENGNWWGRIPSGWIALEYQGDRYVK